MTVSIQKFRIIVLVSNRIGYWSNYSIRFTGVAYTVVRLVMRDCTGGLSTHYPTADIMVDIGSMSASMEQLHIADKTFLVFRLVSKTSQKVVNSLKYYFYGLHIWFSTSVSIPGDCKSFSRGAISKCNSASLQLYAWPCVPRECHMTTWHMTQSKVTVEVTRCHKVTRVDTSIVMILE